MTEKLLERGDGVAATARNTNALSDLKDRYGDLLWTAGLDVTDTAAVRDVVARAFADLGRIDVIVNNAGYGLFGAAEELSDQQILEQINTNLVGPIQVIRAALPHLREQGGGRIIQLSTYGMGRHRPVDLSGPAALRAFPGRLLDQICVKPRSVATVLCAWSREANPSSSLGSASPGSASDATARCQASIARIACSRTSWSAISST